jgi:hypothetical protein
MIFDRSYVFAAYALFVMAFFFLVVHKEKYKLCLIYRIIFGGILIALLVTTLSYFNFIDYKHLGYFNILNLLSS